MRRGIISLSLWLSVWSLGCGVQTEPAPQQKKQSAEKNLSATKNPKPDIDNVEKKMLERLQSQAREYIRTSNWAAADRTVSKGLKKTQDRIGLEITNAHFLMLRGNAALAMGNESDARRYFTDALAVFHVHKNEEGRFEAFTALGRLEARRGDYAAAERQFDQAEALKPKLRDRKLAGKFLMEKGRLASREMKRTDSVRLFQEAIEIFEAAKDKRAAAEVLVLLAQEEDFSNHMSTARRSLERAATLFGEVDDPAGKVHAIHRLATYAEREKQTAKAARLYSEAAELYRQLGRRSAAAGVERHLNTLSTGDKSSKKK
jgi:tetratricopeptide (TPR) repeat protein